MLELKSHWETVYERKSVTEVSWFQPQAELSLRLIQDAGLSKSAAVVDVGGGASTLVDGLIESGFRNLTVLDLSGKALAESRSRLRDRAARVHWIEGDILRTPLPKHGIDLWHDRAVFHFLTDPEDRAHYVRAVSHAVKPGGIVIVATFAEDGPEKCSGLPVERYSPDALHDEFGPAFSMIAHERESHRTPSGAEQKFVYCMCRTEFATGDG